MTTIERNIGIEFEGSREGNFTSFLETIGRSDLVGVITPETPMTYWTMEAYLPGVEDGNGKNRPILQGSGGLGMLAGDTFLAAQRLDMPFVMVTAEYPIVTSQIIEEDGRQSVVHERTHPDERGFSKIGDVQIETRGNRPSDLEVYARRDGSTTIVTITEPNFGQLYQGENNSDHRLYQEVAVGFGGFKALDILGVQPAMNHQLNEAPTVFAGLARLDAMMVGEGADFGAALEAVRAITLYTNHTLVQAAEASFSLDQFERFVFPNIANSEVRNWISGMFEANDGSLRLSKIAIELAGKKNGVSRIHADFAGNEYKDKDGNPVKFEAVTNGIVLERWVDPELLAFYKDQGILDNLNLPAEGTLNKIQEMDFDEMRQIKEKGRGQLREYLTTRLNQRGETIRSIPQDAIIMNWRRRIAGYKRPEMIFSDSQRLAEIMERENIHFVMAGKAHPSDTGMQNVLTQIFRLIDSDPVLSSRVHFVQNYDEDLARALVQGADISINTPIVRDHTSGRRVSTEACGTSYQKDIANGGILISTEDGGVADIAHIAAEMGVPEDFDRPYLQITGNSHNEEVDSLYGNIQRAAEIIRDKGDMTYEEYVKRQTAAFLPLITGSRMVADYLNLSFPKAS